MAETIKGVGVVWSVGTHTWTGGITSSSTANNLPQSIRVQRTSEESRIKSLGGEIVSVVFHGFMKTASLTIVPSADTIANANTASDTYTPPPGTQIILTDDVGTILADQFNVTSATQNRTVDDVVTIDLELEAGDETVELAGAAL